MAEISREYVRVCPVCETENPPAAMRCTCGALLTGVDFSLKRPVVETPPAPEPAKPQAGSIICPHADCAQPNPPGRERCVYCDRPLSERAPDLPGVRPLPAALRNDYRTVEAFPVSGSEADLLLVEHVRSGERCVAKLYRKGLEPDFRLLDILSQTVGNTVVRVLAHGVSDGVVYELLEYIPGGTLQDLLREGPLARADVRRIVQEIAEALNGIHAHRILHRDLKPENVLVRSREPLELALTDFGIASLSEATQHFTSGARTTKYAAPEALIGVIDDKADWWSLGMIALEASTGHHPFDGLTEHVINHHLATKPIDTRSVYDDDVRLLCRGLLLRDPKRRWSAAEVERWLAGDMSLTVPEETAAGAVRPYRIGSSESTSAHDLAIALAKHWDEARRDLARGQIASWVENELHDHNLVRKLRDIADQRDMSDDARLLRFLLAAAPDLPPVWLGQPLSDAAIFAAARRAATGDQDAEKWLDSLNRDHVLTEFAHADLRDIDRWWRESWTHFAGLWKSARESEAKWRRQPRKVAGLARAEVVSYDDVMYGSALRLEPPPQRAVNASLLLAQADGDYVAGLRGEVAAAVAEVSGYCPWYETLWDNAERDPVGVLVMHALMRPARDDATQEKRRLGVSEDARRQLIAEARAELKEALGNVLALARAEGAKLDDETVTALLDAVVPLQKACERALGLTYPDAGTTRLREDADRISMTATALQRALAQCEQVRAINAIFMRPERMLLAGVIVLFVVGIRAPLVGLTLVGAAVAWIFWRLNLEWRTTSLAASRLRSLRTYAESLEAG